MRQKLVNNKEEMLSLANSAISKMFVISTKFRLTRLEVTLELAIIRFIIELALMLQRERFQISHIVRVRKILKIDPSSDSRDIVALEILIYLDPFKEMKIPGEIFLQSITLISKRLSKIAFLCK